MYCIASWNGGGDLSNFSWSIMFAFLANKIKKKKMMKKNYVVDMRRLKTLRRIHLFYPCEDNRTQSCKIIDNWYPVISTDGLEIIGDNSREDGKENGGYIKQQESVLRLTY